MMKCLLIYLWIYIGLFYMIEAGDDDEHVHIKLHMTSGQSKRAQIQPHHQHHKKRHANPHHHPRPHHQQQHSHPLPPPVATTTTNLYHDSPHNYLTGTTATSSSSLLPQNHVFQSAHTKKFPSSSPLNLHESGQLLNMEEDVFGQGDVVGDAAVVSVDTIDGEPMTIPSYLAKNFASFPRPTTTYETEIIPHNTEGFNVVSGGLDGIEDMEEDNEITASMGRGKGILESMIFAEHQMENNHHPHHHRHHKLSSTTKTIKNEQLLQQLLQQHQNGEPEIMNTSAYKSAKLRANKHKAEKDYHSEDDITEAMMYSSSVFGDTRHNPAQSSKRPTEDVTANSGSIKALTVDDIWSQLQQQYLSKYSPQAQPLASADSDEQSSIPTAAIKTKPKRKRNTKRQRHANPTSYSTSWPPKTLSYTGNSHHSKHYIQPIKQLQQQQHYYDDFHSPPSATAFSGISLSSYRDSDFFAKRPFNKFNAHNYEDEIGETDEEPATEFSEGGNDNDDDDDDDDFEAYGDESFEEAVYQRGKKFAGNTAYGQQQQQQHRHTNNPFNNRDLYGSFSTPITATVATNVQASTYHPNLVPSTLPSFTSATTNAFLPTLSHPSTSYQWHTQENYPSSYQTYHLQHQQPPQWTAGEQSSALRSPKATIIQTPNTIVSAKLSPTQSNDFSVPSSTSSSSSVKSTAQSPARYKKRKNRIKPKRNRIVVI